MDAATGDVGKRAVVTVGEGRGFIVETTRDRLVVTAAHCLPHFPPALAIALTQERTYAALLGPLGGREADVWTECMFADPIADIAVLGAPDYQALFEEAEAYDELIDDGPVLQIADPPPRGPAWLLTLDGQWARCEVQHSRGPLWISDAAEPIMGGMSGSPILDPDGAAIGVVCCSSGGPGEIHTEGGPNPKLTDSLPGWMLRELAAR